MITKHSARRAPRRARRGFTLVELVVAIILLSIGIIGLASTAGYVTRQMAGSSVQTVASSVAQNRIDSLTSIGCSRLVAPMTGSATTRGISETWTVKDTLQNVKKITLALTVPLRRGAPKTINYTTFIPCRAQ
ncbi:MAG TPA: prepilin-type N-terminal cleavage/methylation domain-containing protein [Gemmatimonadaceae bacterium]|nr:prepilin-type N-terminal cleavage/methylation domain-containing protein [Gemmatimonadaceae bacterium]